MKILYSWLCDFIENPPPAEELPGKFARLGLGVESSGRSGAAFTGVVVGRIEKIDKHPNADKLSLVDVNDGSATMRVVCGARNIAVGQMIPFARVGAMLAEGELKKAKIRGVESEGMICSAGELGLEGYDNSGILVLDPSAPLGADARTLFAPPDWVFELEITPNLAYCLSHHALARELCVFYGLNFKEPALFELPKSAGTVAPVSVTDPSLCPRYTAVVMKGLKGARTPDWMAARLRAMGSNPKGNLLIDVSNYVMYELGQPTHCFDLANLAGPGIKVRPAADGENMKALDGSELKLGAGTLVIADREKPVALAGVMGGFYSSVADTTDAILIESASFSQSAVRASSRKSGIKSESSYRFERGTDIELTMKAARRIAGLLLEAVPSARIEQVSDNFPEPPRPPAVTADPARINAILGTAMTDEKIFACLKAIQPALSPEKPWKFTPPSYRRDIETVQDLAEEAARYNGYDLIPSASSMPVMPASSTPTAEAEAELRGRLAALGFSEVYNYDLVPLKDFRACLLDETQAVELLNPLSSDYQYLRVSMLPGLLKTLRYNLNRGRTSVAVFETGTVYHRTKDGKKEERVCAGLMYGPFPEEQHWRGGSEMSDFYHLKGVMQAVFGGRRGFRFEKPKHRPAFLQEGAALVMKLGAGEAGVLGLADPMAVINSDLKDTQVYYFEISLAALAESWRGSFRDRVPQVRAVSAFPAAWRDLSVLVDEKREWSELEKDLGSLPDLSRLDLIDVYKGKGVPEGQRSLTLRFTFSSMERTFTDADVNSRMEKALKKLEASFGARLRG